MSRSRPLAIVAETYVTDEGHHMVEVHCPFCRRRHHHGPARLVRRRCPRIPLRERRLPNFLYAMTGHRCDPSRDPSNTPVSELRSKRLLAARLKGDDDALLAAHQAIAGCPKCLHEALNYVTDWFVSGLGENRADALMAFELQVAELERRTGWTSD